MRVTVWGIVLVLASGLIYTMERVAAWLAWGATVAGYNAGGRGAYDFKPTMPGFADNGFVPFFLVAGLILIVIGLATRRELQENTTKS